ncbi:hypothetical protein WIS52_15615 [Pseudonocardia nematodicida]|uniref:Uncharacterized protein n=1 Tax=Pseudonocardia nematodicida TaxID=1206997 RepID=A0ABV1KBR1_9PSEU
MTGPNESRPHPAPRDGAAVPRPSPGPRHGFPEDSYQGGGYPDLRSSRPTERAAPAPNDDLYGGYGDPGRAGTRAAAEPAGTDGSGDGADAGAGRSSAASAGAYRYDGSASGPYGQDGSYGHDGSPARGGHSGDGAPAGFGGYDGAGGSASTEDASPMRYQGYGAPVESASPHRPWAQDPLDARAAYGEFGDPTSRGGTAIDGGPPYTVPPAQGYGATDEDDTPPRSRTAVVDPGPAAVPAQRAPADDRPRPATVAEAAAERFGPREQPTGPGPRASEGPARTAEPAGRVVPAAKDPTALTVLRVLTYVLVSLSCLVFLAAAVYWFVAWLDLRAALGGSSLFERPPMFGG